MRRMHYPFHLRTRDPIAAELSGGYDPYNSVDSAEHVARSMGVPIVYGCDSEYTIHLPFRPPLTP